ncbi:hypothetical protein PVAP13_3KG066900 [Panicum virgatum]|uniref:Uncharacterized protein n=1 Tax=Panicum virgatum TaxID=38727 RepID=A0A8T0UHN8_PANVG|nr:hypothetical protein PVAP13_3KG066900 [Panicum virgatum]
MDLQETVLEDDPFSRDRFVLLSCGSSKRNQITSYRLKLCSGRKKKEYQQAAEKTDETACVIVKLPHLLGLPSAPEASATVRTRQAQTASQTDINPRCQAAGLPVSRERRRDGGGGRRGAEQKGGPEARF